MAKSHNGTGGGQTLLAWQGWQIQLPRDCNPVRIEGGWNQGYCLIADLHRPRLGLRWGVVRERRFEPEHWSRRAIRDEIGQLAAQNARPLPLEETPWQGSVIFLDPSPPGRDVWVAFSPVSGRVVEVIHHAQRRDEVLSKQVVPTLRDLPPQQPMRWSIYQLGCTVPAEMRLKSHRLNAGDLALVFADERRLATVRQIAVAGVALSRMPLQQWLRNDQRAHGRMYRPIGELSAASVALDDGREISGIRQSMRRKRRFLLLRSPPQLVSLALHDQQRDRLILVQASEESMARDIIASMGQST